MTQKAYQKLAAMKRNRRFADEARTMKKQNDDALRAYETEAEQVLAAVKARHDYDRLVADGETLSADIARYDSAALHASMACVVDVLAELFRASGGYPEALRSRLEELWGIEILTNDNVNHDTFVDCFTAFAIDAGAPNWMRAHVTRLEDGRYKVENDMRYTWSPCVSVKFPADGALLSDPVPFLDFAKKELAGMSENWAEKWISDNRHDETRQKALLAALQKKYAPKAGPGEDPK